MNREWNRKPGAKFHYLQWEDPIPRFFFDHWDEQRLVRDDDGLELPDLDAAYLEAFQAATDMWVEALRRMHNPCKQRIEIRDTSDRVLLVLPLSEIVETGAGARRPVPNLAALLQTTERARTLQAEVAAQIDATWEHIRETKEALARLDAAARE